MMENMRLLLGAIALLSGLKVGWEFLLGPRAALRQVVPEVFGQWQAENLTDYSVPHFFQRPDRSVDGGRDRAVAVEDVQDLFKVYSKQLGKLKTYRVVEEKIGKNAAAEAKASTYANYKLEAEFEKAPATIRLYMDLYGSWKLSHFIVQSEVLSPCLAQVNWQFCSAEQAQKMTPQVVQKSLERLMKRRECVRCDLSYLNLAGTDLTKVNLTGANLTGTNLAGAHLNGAKLKSTKLKSANLTEALLVGVDLSGAVAPAVIFTRAKLAGADLSHGQFIKAGFEGANLRGVRFEGSDLEQANFYQANLRESRLRGSSLFRANLRQANLEGAQLAGSNLQCASLGGAYGDGMGLDGALLDGTVLPNQARVIPVTIGRRKDVALRCST
jgi:uncharacterized protein YjbI with pentapeptide repeats